MSDVVTPASPIDVAAIEAAAGSARRSHKVKRPGPGRPPKSESEPAPAARKYKRAADVPVKLEFPATTFDPADVQALMAEAAAGIGQIAKAATVYVSAMATGTPRVPRDEDAARFGAALVQLMLLYLPDVALTTGQVAMLSCAGLAVAMVANAEPVTAPPSEPTAAAAE